MAMWDPWHGCHRYSAGCAHCYIHKGDARRGVDTNAVVRTARFAAPVEKNARGEYKMKGGQTVYLCFSSDFLLEDADDWRTACWEMIQQRPDLHFLFLTKRIERFLQCIPADWGDGYANVTVGCTVENAETAATRLAVFDTLPIRHKNIICQPLLTAIDLSAHLGGVELVVAGGESDRAARPLEYAWILDIRAACITAGVPFEFRQCGTYFVKDGRQYHLQTKDLCSQARKAGINWPEK